MDLVKDCDGWYLETFGKACIIFHLLPPQSLHSHTSLSVLPTSLFGEVGEAVCSFETYSERYWPQHQVSYCKWIHFYRSYFHGTKMMSVNKNAFRLGKHSGVSLPDCQCCSLYGKRFEIRGFGGCIFASTVICTESMVHCMFIVSLLYGCPSYYFLLVWVLILHICKQLCTYAAVVPQRPYAFPFQGKIPWRILTGYHHKRYIVVPKKK